MENIFIFFPWPESQEHLDTEDIHLGEESSVFVPINKIKDFKLFTKEEASDILEVFATKINHLIIEEEEDPITTLEVILKNYKKQLEL